MLAQVLRRDNIVDTLWGLGPCLIAVTCAGVAIGYGSGDPVRRGLLLFCVLVWGLRLSWHVGGAARARARTPDTPT